MWWWERNFNVYGSSASKQPTQFVADGESVYKILNSIAFYLLINFLILSFLCAYETFFLPEYLQLNPLKKLVNGLNFICIIHTQFWGFICFHCVIVEYLLKISWDFYSKILLENAIICILCFLLMLLKWIELLK